MNALSIYLAACRYVMAADFNDRESWADLYRYLPYLRQALSCFVCRNLALAPHFPSHNMCQHFVCKKCIGKRMRLKPQCSWCRNYKGFVENTQLRIVVLCFKKLCEYINDSPIGQDLRSLASNGETDNLVIIIQEAIAFEDDFHLTSSLPLPPALSTAVVQNKPRQEKCKNSKPIPSTSSCSNSTHQASTSDEGNGIQTSNEKEMNDSVSSEPEINVTDIGTQELSPLFTEEIIDVCKIPVVKECEKNLKRRQEPIITLENLQNTNLLDQKLMINCVDSKKDNPCTTSSLVEISIKKPKTVSTSKETLVMCKCGRGGTNSRLTCLGQRCPCYIKKLPCINCKCKGCRNPRKAFDPDKDQRERLLVNQDGVSSVVSSTTQNDKICVT